MSARAKIHPWRARSPTLTLLAYIGEGKPSLAREKRGWTKSKPRVHRKGRRSPVPFPLISYTANKFDVFGKRGCLSAAGEMREKVGWGGERGSMASFIWKKAVLPLAFAALRSTGRQNAPVSPHFRPFPELPQSVLSSVFLQRGLGSCLQISIPLSWGPKDFFELFLFLLRLIGWERRTKIIIGERGSILFSARLLPLLFFFFSLTSLTNWLARSFFGCLQRGKERSICGASSLLWRRSRHYFAFEYASQLFRAALFFLSQIHDAPPRLTHKDVTRGQTRHLEAKERPSSNSYCRLPAQQSLPGVVNNRKAAKR